MVVLTWFSVLVVLVFVPLLFSHSVCLHEFHLRLGSYVAIFLIWERAAHLLNRIFSFYHVYLPFCRFKDWVLTLVIAFPFTFVKYFYLFLDGYTYLTRKSQNRKSNLLKLVFSG